MIQIMKLNGTDKQLYKLVAPLVMDPEVLKMNNNYPFKTTDKFVWFVAVSGKKVVGFIPIEQRGNVAIINNYYIDKTILIEQVVETRSEVTLFTRPRRFGKSLNMSMLQSFFEIGTDPSLSVSYTHLTLPTIA